jgi:hypothetical protein
MPWAIRRVRVLAIVRVSAGSRLRLSSVRGHFARAAAPSALLGETIMHLEQRLRKAGIWPTRTCSSVSGSGITPAALSCWSVVA